MASLRVSLLSKPLGRRVAVPTALGLLVVAAVHLIDGPTMLSRPYYVGTLELALTVACVPLALLLLVRPIRPFWHVSGALCTAALLVYVASRTVGLPDSMDDIGNWFQTIGVVNVISEAAVVTAAAVVVLRRGDVQSVPMRSGGQ